MAYLRESRPQELLYTQNGPSLPAYLYQSLCSTKGGYDRIARKFDYSPFCSPLNRVQTFVEYLKPYGPFRSAADLCTGTGVGIEALLPVVSENIVGIDFSLPMLQEAQKKLATRQVDSNPRIDLVCQDILELDYQSRFDLITSFGAGLAHFEKKSYPKVFSNIHKMLKPSGLLVFDAFDKPALPLWLSVSFSIFDNVMKIRNRILGQKFLMFYRNIFVPDILEFFDNTKWNSTHIVPVGVGGCLVIARKS